MTFLWYIVFFIFGLFVGSFLNVCIDRLPAGQSIVRPPSHCSSCNKKLGFMDLIPVFSYIGLRGKCRYCGARLPVRLPVVEAITAVLFTFFYWKYGFSLDLAVLIIYTSVLIAVFVIDLENLLVLNKIVYPTMLIAVVFSFFWPGVRTFNLFGAGIAGAFGPTIGIESAVIGGVVGLAIQAIPFFIYRQGMGMGDVKLGALVGLMVGFPFVIIAIIMAWILGGLVAGVLLALKIKGRKDAIPAAIFLSVTALVTLVFGQAIWQWYLF